jgi:putative transposase
LRGLEPSGLDQIWVADITYIRLREAFGYLAVILDGFSRKVVGWALAPHLDASLAVEALDHALADRKPTPASLIHHSDRGVQYASTEYRQRLAGHDITVSMSRPGNPYDNAKAESFIKTLKAEEVDGRSLTQGVPSASSSTPSTIPSAFTPRSATARRLNSKPTSR